MVRLVVGVIFLVMGISWLSFCGSIFDSSENSEIEIIIVEYITLYALFVYFFARNRIREDVGKCLLVAFGAYVALEGCMEFFSYYYSPNVAYDNLVSAFIVVTPYYGKALLFLFCGIFLVRNSDVYRFAKVLFKGEKI